MKRQLSANMCYESNVTKKISFQAESCMTTAKVEAVEPASPFVGLATERLAGKKRHTQKEVAYTRIKQGHDTLGRSWRSSEPEAWWRSIDEVVHYVATGGMKSTRSLSKTKMLLQARMKQLLRQYVKFRKNGDKRADLIRKKWYVQYKGDFYSSWSRWVRRWFKDRMSRRPGLS